MLLGTAFLQLRCAAAPTTDVAAPSLQSAVVAASGLTLTLTYNEALDDTSEPGAGDYALTGTASAVSAVNVTGSTVVLTLNAEAYAADLIRLSYTPPGSGKVRDLASNNAAALSAEHVTNNSAVDPADFSEALSSALDFVSNASNVSATGTAIDSVTDLTGGGNHMAATGTARPTLTAVDATLGSLPTIGYDGSNDQSIATGLDLTTPSKTHRRFVFTVIKQNAWVSGRNIISDSTSAYCVVQMGTASGRIQQNNGTARNDNTGLGATGVWGLVIAVFTASSMDCLSVKGRLAAGDVSAGGNGPGTGRKHATNAGGSSFASVQLRLHGEAHNVTLRQLCQLKALVSADCGAGVLA